MELYPMVEKPVELLGAQLFHRCISMMSRTDVDFQRLRQRLDRMQVIMASSAGRHSVERVAGGGHCMQETKGRLQSGLTRILR
ncbi:hypothetical protein OsJ_06463 [Oryza sativa Japonica Group]|uniref:Uncharacterized protein n=1 Tax=Oryza sativa subsp. japonica TaxID=39947 RepID=B9F5B7_ORYSJ|nr:hypothetical protein OsJ_06463 [Oryza sativa Japonica Group]